MPRDVHCIQHRQDDIFVRLRWDYQELFRDSCTAAVVDTLEFFTDGELTHRRPDAPSDFQPWKELTLFEITEHMVRLYSENKVRKSLEELESLEIISVDPSTTGRGRMYLLHYRFLQWLLEQGKSIFEIDQDTLKTAGQRFRFPRNPLKTEGQTLKIEDQTLKTAGQTLKIEGCPNKEEERSIRTTRTEEPLLPGNDVVLENLKPNIKDVPETNRTPEDPPSQPQEALAGPDDSAVDVVKRLYRGAKRAHVDNLATRKAQELVADIERKAEDVGIETFARALKAFLASEDDFLTQNRYPLRVFVKQFRQWVERVEDAPPPAPPRPERPAFQPVTSTTSHFSARDEGIPAGPQLLSCDAVRDLWNEHVPSAPQIMGWVNDWTAAARTPLFQQHMVAIFDKCEALIRAKKLKFVPTCGWILKGENWLKVLNGEYDWALPEGAAAASAPAPDADQDDDNRLYELPPDTDPFASLRAQFKRRNKFVDWFTGPDGGLDPDTRSEARRRVFSAFDGIGDREDVLRDVLDELKNKTTEERWAIIERVEREYPQKESR